MAHESSAEAQAGLTALQKVVLALLAVTLTGSVALRALSGPAPQPAGDAPAGAQGFTAAGAQPEAAEPGPLERLLPYLTEASLFGLIGFALGYTTRKLFKLALILVAIGFVALQAMVYAGWFEVDWGGLLGKLNEWIFNLKESTSVSEFLTDRVPAAGSLLVGALVGFRRG